MPEVTLAAEVGRPTGSKASNRLRAAGKIPGVVYGHGNDPVPVAIEARALRNALTTDAGTNVVLNLELGGRAELVITKAIQRNATRNVVTHVDFLVVRRDEVVTTDVPVTLVGEPTELLRAQGVLDHELTFLTVQSVPGRIPNQIEIDVSGFTVGDAVRVGDLQLPEGVTTEMDPDHVVVIGQPPQLRPEDMLTEGEREEAAAEAQAVEAAGGEGEGEATPDAE